MAELPMDGSLQVERHERFHEREARVSVVLWFVLLAVVVLTLLGLFGNGPLSRARTGRPGGPLQVEYARFARFGASVRMVVHARPQGGALRVIVSDPLLDAFRVASITPPPVSAAAGPDGVEYRFDAAGRAAVIVFELEPARRWRVQGTVSAVGETAAVSQFIYP